MTTRSTLTLSEKDLLDSTKYLFHLHSNITKLSLNALKYSLGHSFDYQFLLNYSYYFKRIKKIRKTYKDKWVVVGRRMSIFKDVLSSYDTFSECMEFVKKNFDENERKIVLVIRVGEEWIDEVSETRRKEIQKEIEEYNSKKEKNVKLDDIEDEEDCKECEDVEKLFEELENTIM